MIGKGRLQIICRYESSIKKRRGGGGRGKGKGNPTTLVPRDDETCFSPRILPSIRRGDSSLVRDSRSPIYTWNTGFWEILLWKILIMLFAWNYYVSNVLFLTCCYFQNWINFLVV